ncbi:septum formation initiator [Bacteriovorax sp. Seq25_V]|uniref:septum formation initiator n=1 Tax=Bacteriovorax sp. Seq25_V TaxID=1201288 RepID=UPI000389E433|nr:septum formation initiator [Bacteriovorax sp. Seq25_V]EQC45398.1 septum formation initiator [Bacteriovorax sp. Seq25_V]
MQFSFERKSAPTGAAPQNAASSNNVGSSADDKLRKAIERNREKMLKRQGSSAASASTGMQASAPQRPRPMGSTPPPVPNQTLQQRLNASQNTAARPASSAASSDDSTSLLEKMRARRAQASGKDIPRPSVTQPVNSGMSGASGSTTSSMPRRTVTADPDKIELAGNLRKGTTAPAVVNYGAEPIKAPVKKSVSAKRKLKTKNKNTSETSSISSWFVKGTWMFCAFLIGRLIFSDGGVVEYLDKKAVYDQKVHELEITKKDNALLMQELELIKSDGKYQKKLVRDHLGYIAKDEYLVLFSKGSEASTENRDISSI